MVSLNRARARIVRVALAVALAAGALLGGAAVRAGATERGPLTVRQGKVTQATFPALVGAVPSSEEEVRPQPTDCKNYVWCDTVLLDTVLPENLKEDDDWVLQVEVGWDNPSGTNDIDIFLYDDGQKKGGAGYTLVGSGGGADNPEKAKALHPDGRYNLVVLNFTGGNTGYTVKATVVVAPFTSPYEALAPSKSPTTTSKPATEETAPKESLGAAGPSTTTTLAPVAARADDAFDFGPSSFEDDLSAPDFGPDGAGGPAPVAKTTGKDVSGVAVALWLIGTPVALGALGAAWFLRRRATFAIG